MLNFKIKDFLGNDILLKPRVENYEQKTFMGKTLPGLAIVLDIVDESGKVLEQFDVLTKSFGEYIGIKNAAYIDTNNCSYAEQLLQYRIAVNTGITKESGFCIYPLWRFDEAFLKEIGSQNYLSYASAYDKLMGSILEGEPSNEEPTEEKNDIKM